MNPRNICADERQRAVFIRTQPWFIQHMAYRASDRTVLAGTSFRSEMVAVFPTAKQAIAAVDAHNGILQDERRVPLPDGLGLLEIPSVDEDF